MLSGRINENFEDIELATLDQWISTGRSDASGNVDVWIRFSKSPPPEWRALLTSRVTSHSVFDDPSSIQVFASAVLISGAGNLSLEQMRQIHSELSALVEQVNLQYGAARAEQDRIRQLSLDVARKLSEKVGTTQRL